MMGWRSFSVSTTPFTLWAIADVGEKENGEAEHG